MDRTDMLIVESNCHNPDVNMLFDQYTLVRIEYLIGCDRVHGKTKNLEQNQYFVRVCMVRMNYICRKKLGVFLKRHLVNDDFNVLPSR